VDYVYVWADGVHVNVRLGDQDRLCLLVLLGVWPDGTKELIAVEDGYRESTEGWAHAMRDLKRRGMRAPELVIGDGALGFWAAVRDVWPETAEQRHWVHRIRNVLDKLPKRLQAKAKEALQLAHPEAGRVEEHDLGPVGRIRGGPDQGFALASAEHGREGPLLLRPGNPVHHSGPAHDPLEEEAEGAHRLSVVGPGDLPVLDEVDQVAANLPRAGLVQGGFQPTEEAPHVGAVDLPRTGRESRQHHRPTQRLERLVDGAVVRLLGCGPQLRPRGPHRSGADPWPCGSRAGGARVKSRVIA